MIDRRDTLAGLACVAALATAEALRPRRLTRLLPPNQNLRDLVPKALPGWDEGEGGDIVLPRTKGSLAATIYDDEMARIYQPAGSAGATLPVMLLVSYGSSQSDTLQLHRPEECYPAVGFQIVDRQMRDLALRSGTIVPAVALTARYGERVEDIVYWTRLGEALPRTSGEQRWQRLRAAMAGDVTDGALVRASAIRNAPDQARFAEIDNFLLSLILAMTPLGRIALLGHRYSSGL